MMSIWFTGPAGSLVQLERTDLSVRLRVASRFQQCCPSSCSSQTHLIRTINSDLLIFIKLNLIILKSIACGTASHLSPLPPRRRFSENLVAQMWYFVKCVYFGLSAYQIRCGYPTRVLGNFLTKSYNYVNLFLFQG